MWPRSASAVLERGVVFDNAVVNQRDAVAVFGVIGVGVCVAVGRLAVGSPTGMGNAERAMELPAPGLFLENFFQHTDATYGFRDVKIAVEHSEPSRVIASVFKALQTLQQNG